MCIIVGGESGGGEYFMVGRKYLVGHSLGGAMAGEYSVFGGNNTGEYSIVRS